MNKFIKFLSGAVAGVALAAAVSLAGNAIGTNVASANPAAASCIKVTDGINVNSQNANATVDLDPGCGTHKLVLKSWYAPDARGGASGPQQVLYAQTATPVTMSGSTPATKIHVAMFNATCFYQVDLVDITNEATNTNGNPIVKAAVGGTHDCRPDQTHAYICSALAVTPGANRLATITTFTTSVVNARFTGATISWGDGTSSISDSVVNVAHTYAADGNYTVSVVADFVYTNRYNQEVRVSAPACTAQLTYTTTPPETKMINVCEISTKRTIRIDEKLLGTAQYPNDKYTTDLSKCVVKNMTVCVIADKTIKTVTEEEFKANPSLYTTDMNKCVPTVTPPPVTPPTVTPPATLVNTGPGSTIALAGTVSVIAAAAHAIYRKRFTA